jgi:hypothetical protein
MICKLGKGWFSSYFEDFKVPCGSGVAHSSPPASVTPSAALVFLGRVNVVSHLATVEALKLLAVR